MQVTPSTNTVAQYCSALEGRQIIVNTDYQRGKVWPPAARSYLIDTILGGYPIPKISLYQVTDLRSRKTVSEIVDGQQRSHAIFDFFSDRLRISGRSVFAGKRYSDLDEPDQQRFLAYQLSVDLFVSATEADIRQVFRRMNSYTIPLNPQERRHATFQGKAKWFLSEASDRYGQALKDMGVFREKQLARMDDTKLLTDICLTVEDGIKNQSEPNLNKYYEDREDEFAREDELRERLEVVFSTLLGWTDLHRGPLMRSYMFHSLAVALTHCLEPSPALQDVYRVADPVDVDDESVLPNLSTLAEALENSDGERQLADFVKSTEATTRIIPRTSRFRWFCRALEPALLRETP